LEHNYHNIAIGNLTDIGLDSSNPRFRQKGFDSIFPLVSEEGVVNDNKCGNTKTRGDVERTDSFASSRVERNNSIMGFGKQE
jgi:hypothetical protein